MGKDSYTVEMFGERNEVKLSYNTYMNNGTLALQLLSKAAQEEIGFYAEGGKIPDDPFVVPYGTVTVNLPESEGLGLDEQFVNENNLPGIGRWLEKSGIAERTGEVGYSGYCSYPAYRFKVPKEVQSQVIDAREDVIARRLIEYVERSGLKPCETNDRGDRYHIAEGTDIALYKGGTDPKLGRKPDVFLLARSSRQDDMDMWRLRNLPYQVRKTLATDIQNAVTASRSSTMKIH